MVTLDQAGAARAATRLRLASPRTRDWIEHLCAIDHRQAPYSSGGWRIVPDACPHLIAAWGAAGVRAIIVGARSVFTDRPAGGRLATVGVRFRPGALPHLTGQPADDLTDQSVSVETVWGPAGRDLIARLEDADPLTEAGEVLESFVAGLVRDSGELDWRAAAVRSAASRHGGTFAVGSLARELGVSERSLRDASRRVLGLPPKRLARIQRLLAALTTSLSCEKSRARSWSRVAAWAGYADQPHLIREFRALLGEAPETFLARGVGP